MHVNVSAFEPIRELITQSYEFLESGAPRERLKQAIIHNANPSDEFLKICKEIKGLGVDLREQLYKTSTVVEKLEGVTTELEWIIGREVMRGKYKDTKFS